MNIRPTRRHLSVQKFVTPEEFKNWQIEAQNLGFKYVASGPLVRSSYKAGELYLHGMIKEREKMEQQQSNSNTL
jgi:lipoic acid synthetase